LSYGRFRLAPQAIIRSSKNLYQRSVLLLTLDVHPGNAWK
jgi:hypothetical protein